MKYFAKIRDIYVEKNSAHKEIQQFALEQDATLLNSDEEKDNFIEKFRYEIKQANIRNKRCKNIEIKIWEVFAEEDISLSVEGNFSMLIYKVKNEF